jgi:cholesterol oxidase
MTLANPDSPADRYDVVVIGSGYGASTVAARVAQAAKARGKSLAICILERGREIESRDFPSRGIDLAEDAQFTDGLGTQGNRRGLFDFHLNHDIDVLVGCGLGGTSLINGGISIVPEARVFEQECWPVELRANALEPYYARARAVLRPKAIPNRPLKLRALKKAAAAIGVPFTDLEINVTYEDAPPGQKPCNLCGDCVTGCNFEAKNTLPYTYLPIAKENGAGIFTEWTVEFVQPDGDNGYVVHATSSASRDKRIEVRARVVVIGAGALGSPGILFRSQGPQFRFSPKLGAGFSTNGDAIAIGYNCNDETNVIGQGHRLLTDPNPPASVGPTLLGMVDARAGAKLEEAVILEDGAFPSALRELLLPFVQVLAASAKKTPHSFASWIREAADLLSTVGVPGEYQFGALNHSMLYLLMGHDGANGQMSLDGNGNIRISWPTLRAAKCFARAEELAEKVTQALGGMFVRDPLEDRFLKGNITVHPLGGCCIGADAKSGVVEHTGRVFNPDTKGTPRTYSGLYVADGSIVPTSLGANPLFTITALSERISDFVIAELWS